MNITEKEGVFYLDGDLTEFADLDVLKAGSNPLLLNLDGVKRLNSMGIRRFLKFIMDWSPNTMRLFNVRTEFISNLNVIPQMLGGPSSRSCVESLYIPFFCEKCQKSEEILFSMEDITFSDSDIKVDEDQTCSSCGSTLDLDNELHEYFLFCA